MYEVRNGKQTAVAAMYSLPFGSTFADVPDVGGALTQWHVHRNLCLTDNPQQTGRRRDHVARRRVPAGNVEGRQHSDAARVDRPEPVRAVRRARGHRRRAGSRRPDPQLRHPERVGSIAGGVAARSHMFPFGAVGRHYSCAWETPALVRARF